MTTESIHQFQRLLRELFQFDCADLDFGIYRILNQKREAIAQFIERDLPTAVAEELKRGELAEQSRAVSGLEDATHEVKTHLGDDALDADGNLDEKYHGTPHGKKYLRAQARAVDSRGDEDLQTDIFNHLYAFFSRYYQDGDFISKRRYSRKSRYAIPYNGEEVYLHWANREQYYIKTAEHFRDYAYTVLAAGDKVTVRFVLREAQVEQNNVKGAARFFIPCASDVVWDAMRAEIIIPFEYRPLAEARFQSRRGHGKAGNSDDVNGDDGNGGDNGNGDGDDNGNDHGQRNGNGNHKQEKLIADALKNIPLALQKNAPQATVALAALAVQSRKNSAGEPLSDLAHHLRNYTRRNTSDFFIHKNLQKFLTSELDFYLKNEVLKLDEVQAAGAVHAAGWFQILHVLTRVGGHIIKFLHQVESFQKTLWEKRKFITATHYCISVGTIAEQYYAAIAECDTQWAEWQALHSIEEVPRDLFTAGANQKAKRIAFLKKHASLMVDTAHLDAPFVDDLLAGFEDLDATTDGVLIHSENWQALNLLSEKYQEKVKCVYIDPPYNTDASAILYKNDYKDSSWLSLMADRLMLARHVLKNDGILCAAIDDEEVSVLRTVAANIFHSELGVVTVRSNPAGRKTKGRFAPAHEYALFYGKTDETVPGSLEKTEEQMLSYPNEDEHGRFMWTNFIRSGTNDMRQDRPKQFYPIFVNDKDELRIPRMEWDDDVREWVLQESHLDNETVVYPMRNAGNESIEGNWHRGHPRLMSDPSEYRVRRSSLGETMIDFKKRMDEDALPKTWWSKNQYASANGTTLLKNIFGSKDFDFPKSVELVKDCIISSINGGTDVNILDFFAGSGTTGHAVINLNREDGGRRKFILVEMGEYFDSVLLPRMKKIAFTPEWKEGKPTRLATAEETARGPRIIKYMRLESYEDALNNIALDDTPQQAMQFEDYFLKYMLHWEAKRSATLLNVQQLARPFDYQLHAHSDGQTRAVIADIAETFNYLIGLHVARRRVYYDGYGAKGRKYLVYYGHTRKGRRTAVIWRDNENWQQADFERDKDFVMKNKLTESMDDIFVNGDSFIRGAKALEPFFKSQLFAKVDK